MPVSLRDCTFGYRRQFVLDEFSLTFPSGRTVLLGPNGAGKTTILSLAASLLRPATGSVCLGDLDASERSELAAYRRRVGWLPQSVRAIGGLRVREQVAYAGWLKGMTRRAAWESSGHALERVGLAGLATRPTRALSGGQLRRMGIAQAIVHQADVMLLDEPAAGLDPLQRRKLRAVVATLGEDASVVVSTHHTDDITDSYDHVIVIGAGASGTEIRFQGSVTEFLALAPADADGNRAELAYDSLVTAEE